MNPKLRAPVDVMLVAGGQYHDIDFARLELLKLLAEDDRHRVRVFADYLGASTLESTTVLVTYTCNVVPAPDQLGALHQWLEAGGRWFALHGTNSVLEFTADGRVATPDRSPRFSALLGSRFASHPPLNRYRVEVADPHHPLTRGLDSFETLDEQYLTRTVDGLQVLLKTRFAGATPRFVESEWPDSWHPVLYVQRVGAGEVLYLTLGHCRGHYDMRPLREYWDDVERCSWELPIFYELLRRGIAWLTQK